MDDRWEGPLPDASMGDRVERLERLTEGMWDQQQHDGRLTAGVERLGDNTEALTRVLTAVDEQARSLARVDKRTTQVERTAEEAAAEAARERRSFIRRAYLAAGLTSLFALTAVVGGAWLTDAHLQKCLINGPASASEERLCDLTFPGHDHPTGKSIEDILRDRTEQIRAGCERDNDRVRANIMQTEAIQRTLPPGPVRDALDGTLDEFEMLVVDCQQAYPQEQAG